MPDKPKIPTTPEFGEKLSATNPNAEMLEFLARRRSTPIKCLSGPGPSVEELNSLLQIASRVPDHRKLEPWRFIVITDEARSKIGETLAKLKQSEAPDTSDADLELERNRFLRSPICVAVVSSPDVEHKTPVWEQELSAGALCMNLLLTANAAGWAGAWLTEWYSFSDEFKNEMKLGKTERFAGFIFLGTALQDPPERPRPDIDSKILHFDT